MKKPCVGRHFLDSGAHTLYTKEVIKHQHKQGYTYYDSPEFLEYIDDYAAFLKKFKLAIDYYATVDVIFNPQKSWDMLKYMEEHHGLNPIPVVHYGAKLDEVVKHIEAGYKYIGLGGLGQEVTARNYIAWADQVFGKVICNTPDKKPAVKIHGFAMTSFPLLSRYPFWSVDSTSWMLSGAMGSMYVPHKRKGEFVFDSANKMNKPYTITVSKDSPDLKIKGKHYETCTKHEQGVLRDWLEYIGIPFGKMKGDEIIEFGVSTRYKERHHANLLYFEMLRNSLPEWPWVFDVQTAQSLMEETFKPIIKKPKHKKKERKNV